MGAGLSDALWITGATFDTSDHLHTKAAALAQNPTTKSRRHAAISLWLMYSSSSSLIAGVTNSHLACNVPPNLRITGNLTPRIDSCAELS